MAKSALETYQETLEKNRQMQEAMSGSQPNPVSSSLDDELKFQDDLAKFMKLENKQVQNAAKAQEIFDNKASPINTPEDLMSSYINRTESKNLIDDLSKGKIVDNSNQNPDYIEKPLDLSPLAKEDYIKRMKNDPSNVSSKDIVKNNGPVSLEQYRQNFKNDLLKNNPELLKKLQSENPTYRDEAKLSDLDPSFVNILAAGQSPLDNMSKMENPQSPLIKKQELLNQVRAARSGQPVISKKSNLSPENKEDIERLKIQDEYIDSQRKDKKSDTTSGGKNQPNPDTIPIPQLTEDQQILDAQRRRDILSAISLMSKGFEKMGAGMGGGSVTQLKPDYTGAESIEKMGAQSYSDLLEKFKKAKEAREQVKKDLLTDAQIQKMKDDRLTDKERLQIEREKLGIERDKLAAEMQKKTRELNLTDAEKELDKKTADQVVTFEKDKNQMEKGLSLLRNVKAELERSKKDILPHTGPIVGFLTKAGIGATSSTALKEKAHAAALDALKATVGSTAISDADREAVLGTVYNERLSPEQNIDKIQAFIDNMTNTGKRLQSASDYIRKNGTIKGFDTQPIMQGTFKEKEQSDMVEVISPSGKTVSIPRSELNSALASGGKLK